MTDGRKGSQRHVKHKLTAEEEENVYQTAVSPEFCDSTPEEIVAILAERGVYLASPSTFYRILRERKALQHRSESKKPTPPRESTYIEVTKPNQAWAWDITWLKTDVAGLFYYAYNIIDLFDRSLVGWSIEANESDIHSTQLFKRVIRDLEVVPKIVHADNGHPMRGITLAVLLDILCVSRSYSRPRCSNDNAFIESLHKTLKYSVGYPKYFTSLEHARGWYADFVNWYNTVHLHSALGYVTPAQRRSGEAEAIYASRNATILKARELNPLRWRRNTVRIYKSKAVRAFYRPINKKA